MKTIIAPAVLLRVNRAMKCSFPEWAAKWEYGHKHGTSLTIDLGRIVSMGPAFFGNRPVGSEVLHFRLVSDGLIGNCLDIQEGITIASYRHAHSIFGGKWVYLFKAVVRDNKGCLFVPYIQNIRDQMPVIYWWWMEYKIDLRHSLVLKADAD